MYKNLEKKKLINYNNKELILTKRGMVFFEKINKQIKFNFII
jgi:Mn-dependent DtxR family transcriptional regulator